MSHDFRCWAGGPDVTLADSIIMVLLYTTQICTQSPPALVLVQIQINYDKAKKFDTI